jgi:hypothetical protein
MPALDAYHKKIQLTEDFTSRHYREIMHYRVKSVRGDLGTDDSKLQKAVPSFNVYAKHETGDSVFNAMRNAADTGYCYYIAPHMDALVTAASESMPPESPTTPQDPPTAAGFMWIPGGLTCIDIRGRLLKYNAALWNTYGGAIHVWWLTDKSDDQDTTNIELRREADPIKWRQFPQLTPNGEAILPFNEPIPMSIGMGDVLPPELRKSLHYDGKSGNLVFSSEKGYSPEELQEMLKPEFRQDAAAAWLVAAWRLMQQSLTTVEQEDVPRSARKMARRVNMLDEHVTVVDLRHKPTRREGEAGSTEWTHRWLVRGHWRNQPYKEDGVWTTRPIYIHPFVKGPEGAPLVIRDHVYNLKR